VATLGSESMACGKSEYVNVGDPIYSTNMSSMREQV